MKSIVVVVWLLYIVALATADPDYSQQYALNQHLGKECHHEDVGWRLAQELNSVTTLKQIRELILRNGEAARENIQHLIRDIQDVQKHLPDIAKSLKKQLKDCIDGSVIDFSDDICKVPSEEVRRKIIASYNLSPYMLKRLNTGFGSLIPIKSVDTLLAKNVRLASEDLQQQQKYLEHCLHRVDSLAVSVATVLNINDE